MYNGRRVKKTARNHKRTGRNIALLLSLVLLLGAATVGTVAYFTAEESSSTSFSVGEVKCSVSGPDTDGTYTIKNEGTVPAYIRVAVVANVVENDVIQWEVPSVTVDSVDSDDFVDFDEHTDGFWYSDAAVAAGDTISLTVTGNAEIQVVAEAIQGGVPAVAKDAWKYTYS